MVVGRVRGARPLWSNIAPLRRPASRAPRSVAFRGRRHLHLAVISRRIITHRRQSRGRCSSLASLTVSRDPTAAQETGYY
jgi:hypothetical protein